MPKVGNKNYIDLLSNLDNSFIGLGDSILLFDRFRVGKGLDSLSVKKLLIYDKYIKPLKCGINDYNNYLPSMGSKIIKYSKYGL